MSRVKEIDKAKLYKDFKELIQDKHTPTEIKIILKISKKLCDDFFEDYKNELIEARKLAQFRPRNRQNGYSGWLNNLLNVR